MRLNEWGQEEFVGGGLHQNTGCGGCGGSRRMMATLRLREKPESERRREEYEQQVDQMTCLLR